MPHIRPSPFILAMPAAVLLEAACVINRPLAVSAKERRDAFEVAGLTGVRDSRLGPTWRDRLASLFGRRIADAVMDRLKPTPSVAFGAPRQRMFVIWCRPMPSRR
jgi:hypothetical protein